jgi:hypothetical protein
MIYSICTIVNILGWPGPRYGDNIKMDPEDTDWIHVAQDKVSYRAVVNSEMNLQVLYKA